MSKRRTIAQFGIRDTDRNENQESNDLGQPPTIMESPSIDEKRALPLPFELADNELDSFPVELPAYNARSHISDTLEEGNEGTSEDGRPGFGAPVSPPKSARRQPYSVPYSAQHVGRPADGGRPQQPSTEVQNPRPQSEDYLYPTEAILQMKLNDDEVSPGPYPPTFGTAI